MDFKRVIESREINLKLKRYMKISEMVLGDLLHFGICWGYPPPPVIHCRGIGSPDSYHNRKWMHLYPNILGIKTLVLSGTLNLKQTNYIHF
jgi:hypothetical protein